MVVLPLKLLPSGLLAQLAPGDLVEPQVLAEGTPNELMFLRGDQQWAVPPGAEGAVSSVNGKVGNLVLSLGGGALVLAKLDEARRAPSVQLSNGNLTATFDATQGVVLGDSGKSAGKLYFEVRFVSGSTSGNCSVGLAPYDQPLDSEVGYSGGKVAEIGAFQNSGNVYANDGSRVGGISSFDTAGDVVGVAVDCAARSVWFRVNGGQWNGSATASPSSDVGGFAIGGAGEIFPAVCSDVVAVFTANFGGSTFQGALPLGFAPWGGESDARAVTIKDVLVSSPVAGQTLVFDGQSWVNGAASGGSLVVSDAPSAPAGETVGLYGKLMGGRPMVGAVSSPWGETLLQPALFRRKVACWSPAGNGTEVPLAFGMSAATAIGTATARAVAATNRLTRSRRLGYVSAATAGQLAGLYWPQAQWTTGDGAGLGGFFYCCRFAFSDAAAVNGARAFVGMSSLVAAPTNVDPATLKNSIGVVQSSTSAAQLYLQCAGDTTQALIPLGTNFPPMAAAGAANGVLYELTLSASPLEPGVVHYQLERLGTAFVARGRIAAAALGVQVPASSVFLAPRAWRCNNATAAAVGMDINMVYLESET